MTECTFYGLHGTTGARAASIQVEGFRIKPRGGYAGKGVYFWRYYPSVGLSYLTAMELSKAFFRRSRQIGAYEKGSKLAVIDAKVSCNEEMCLDLLDAETKLQFMEHMEELYKKYPSDGRRKRSPKSRKRLRAHLYDKTIELIESTAGIKIGVVTVNLKVPPQPHYVPFAAQELSDDEVFETVVVRLPELVEKISLTKVHAA